jgi:hypothetical protein
MFSQNLLQLKSNHPFLIILAIFCGSLILIVLTRIFIGLLFFFIKRRYQKLHIKFKSKKEKLAKFKLKKAFLPKEDEELFRKKAQFGKIEFPKAHSEIKAELRKKRQQQDSYEIIESQEQRLNNEELNSVEIVDFVKPIGYWTSMVLGKKLTYLIQSAQILNKRGDKGFWASMIEAQERLNNRQKSRGR